MPASVTSRCLVLSWTELGSWSFVSILHIVPLSVQVTFEQVQRCCVNNSLKQCITLLDDFLAVKYIPYHGTAICLTFLP